MKYHGYYDPKMGCIVQTDFPFSDEEEIILPCPPEEYETYMQWRLQEVIKLIKKTPSNLYKG